VVCSTELPVNKKDNQINIARNVSYKTNRFCDEIASYTQNLPNTQKWLKISSFFHFFLVRILKVEFLFVNAFENGLKINVQLICLAIITVQIFADGYQSEHL